MTFDPLKAAREELAGLADVLKAIRRRENAAEAIISEAENELNAIRKIRGFCQILIELTEKRIAELEAKRNM